MGNSPRPAAWVLERSNDYGKTYKPWQYFSEHPSECQSAFGIEANKYIEYDDQIVCTTHFSKAIPLEGGEVVNFEKKNKTKFDYYFQLISRYLFHLLTIVQVQETFQIQINYKNGLVQQILDFVFYVQKVY